MNLKDFLTSRDKPSELFWSVVVEPGWVQAGIWYISESVAEVISIGPGAAWEIDEELVGATDAALSSAVQKLSEEHTEPTKTVFGVPSAWVKGGQINEEYLTKIKKLCTELSLNPVGFVVISEAIAHLYKSEEGAPLNAIILGLGKEFLEVSVFKLGVLVGSTSVSRSVSLTEDVTEGLSRFEGASPLPSRFIVFDGKEGELGEAKELLMQNQWDEGKFRFLHTPKAEVLTSDRKVLATALAGAAEIGHISQVSLKNKETTEESNIVPVPNVSPEDLGFSVGKDVTEVPPTTPPPRPIFRPQVRNLFAGLVPKFGKSFTTLAILIVAVAIAAILFWWFYPKARVAIYVTPKNFQEETNVVFGDAVPAQVLTTQVFGDKTIAATGVKLVGDKAKGTVQIANGNSSAINLTAGTILVSGSGLKFVTNSEASISGQILPGSPGTASVDITAGDIGAQYNLAKAEVFRVGNYSKSLVAGTSQSDFSGGSSQQIAAVSKDDQVNLEKQLKGELIEKAKDELLAKTSSDRIFINDLASLDVIQEDFNHKTGDVADSLKLTLKLDVAALAVDKIKLLENARDSLKSKIPGGYVLRDSQIDFKFAFVNKKDDHFEYKMILSANFLPQVNTNAIIKQISGKTPEVVENYLTQIPGFSRAEVTLKPRFPGFLGVLPRVSKNITIEVTAEK